MLGFFYVIIQAPSGIMQIRYNFCGEHLYYATEYSQCDRAVVFLKKNKKKIEKNLVE